MVSEIQAGQTSSRRPPAHPDTMGENNTPTALKGCGVKTSFLNIPLLVTGTQNQRRDVTDSVRVIACSKLFCHM